MLKSVSFAKELLKTIFIIRDKKGKYFAQNFREQLFPSVSSLKLKTI